MLRPAGDARVREGAGVRRRRGARLRADPRQHLPPDARARARADRRVRRPPRLHGLGPADHHRLRRLPGLLARPRGGGRRGQGPSRAPAAQRRSARDRRAGGPLPLLRGRLRAVPLARALDGGPGGPRLRHRPRLRRVHPLPRRPRLHRRVHRAHPSLARPLPRVAPRQRPARGRPSSGSSRAAPTRTCGASPRRPSPPPASTASRSAAPSAATRSRCARCST